MKGLLGAENSNSPGSCAPHNPLPYAPGFPTMALAYKVEYSRCFISKISGDGGGGGGFNVC